MKARLKRLLFVLGDGLIERDTPIRLALLSALCGEHLLLIGAHGTAKSVLARKLHKVFHGGQYFERLLTKFSVPEELFGPLSIQALENDRYLRLTDRYLPSASIAFIDEIFKANSAILNALLTILNEKEFDNGDQRESVPLISVIGASNELPDEPELQALYDRFLCRFRVKPVSEGQFEQLIQMREPEPVSPQSDDLLDHDALLQLQQQADQLKLADEVVDLLQALRNYLQQQQFYISDRRWRKIVKLLKMSALTNDQSNVTIWDCWLLQHCLWDEPDQRRVIADWYESHIGMGSGFNPNRLEKLVHTWEIAHQTDASSQTPLRNARGEPLYTDQQGQPTTTSDYMEWCERNGKNLYMSPPDQIDRSNEGRGYTFDELQEQFFDDVYQQTHIDGQWNHIDKYIANPGNRLVKRHQNPPQLEPTRHSPDLIERRLHETNAILDDLNQLSGKLRQQRETLEQTIGQHLWVDSNFVETAQHSLQGACDLAEDLAQRMQGVIDGYQALPTLETSS